MSEKEILQDEALEEVSGGDFAGAFIAPILPQILQHLFPNKTKDLYSMAQRISIVMKDLKAAIQRNDKLMVAAYRKILYTWGLNDAQIDQVLQQM